MAPLAAAAMTLLSTGCGTQYAILDREVLGDGPPGLRGAVVLRPLDWVFEAPSTWEHLEHWRAQRPHLAASFEDALRSEGEALPRGVILVSEDEAGAHPRHQQLAVRVIDVTRDWTPFAGCCDYLTAEVELTDGAGRLLIRSRIRATSRRPGAGSWMFGNRVEVALANLARGVVDVLSR